MDPVQRHARRGRCFGMPVHGATAPIGHQPGQAAVHLLRPVAHEPAQRLRERQAGVHGRHGAVHQQVRCEAQGDEIGQAVLPPGPLQRRAQAGGVVRAHRQHDHVEAGARRVLQQLEQPWRVQPVDRQHAPFNTVMPAEAPHELAAQRLFLGRGTHACSTRVARHQQADQRAAPGRAGASARRFGHSRRDAPYMPCLQPKQRPEQTQQHQALPTVVHQRASCPASTMTWMGLPRLLSRLRRRSGAHRVLLAACIEGTRGSEVGVPVRLLTHWRAAGSERASSMGAP
jgi:hypothetical protein